MLSKKYLAEVRAKQELQGQQIRDSTRELKEDFRQQVGILTEDYQSRLGAVVEGQEELKRDLEVVKTDVRAIKTDVEETKAILHVSHGELEHRITDLENR